MIALIDDIKEKRHALVQVQGQLGEEDSLSLPKVPRLHPEEIPEKKYEYTRETLLKFKEEYELRKKMTASAQEVAGGGGGFGGLGGGSSTNIDVKVNFTLNHQPFAFA